MKSKFHNQIKIINYITSTDKFKMLFFLSIIFSAYASFILGSNIDNIIDAIFVPFQFNIFNIIFLSLLFLNNLNTCSIFEKNFDFYIMRLKNKKNYISELIKNTIIINLLYILIFLLFYFSLLILLKMNQFEIHNYANYEISNLFYVIYYLLRYFIIIILINIISTYVYINFKKIITIVINVVFNVGFFIRTMTLVPNNNINIIIWDFFTSLSFSNFSLDILSSISLIIILEIIIIILHKITFINKQVVIT